MEPLLRTKDTDLQDCPLKECKLPKRHEALCDLMAPIVVTYTNWKGDTRRRRISPTGQVVKEANEWHKVPQWLAEAIDHDDGKKKLFAVSGIAADSRTTLQVAIAMRWNT